MKAYVYRFLDKNNKIIYVGFTSQAINKRMEQHFTKGHLPKDCYDRVCKIEYKSYNNACDAAMLEIYYINEFNPVYNKRSCYNEKSTLGVKDNAKWKVYHEFKPAKKYEGFGCMPYIYAALIGIGILFCLLL